MWLSGVGRGAGGGAGRIIAAQEGHKIITPVAASVSVPTKTKRAERRRSSSGGSNRPANCKLHCTFWEETTRVLERP